MQDDEFIMRVADGELDAAERDRAAARLAADPAFSAAVERQRALRRTLAAAFDPCLRGGPEQETSSRSPPGAPPPPRAASARRTGVRWRPRSWSESSQASSSPGTATP
jgi:anti-sigma factor RsiW